MDYKEWFDEDVRKDDHHRRIIMDDNADYNTVSDLVIDEEDDIEDSIEESRIDTYRYYHLSEIFGLNMLEPSISDNFMTKNGYEENKTPRVCFAPSIDQCLMAMSANIKDKGYYVYIPYNIDVNKLRKPTVKDVPDSTITGEVWSLEPIKVKCVGKIKVLNAKDISHSYTYGNNKNAELWEWEYKLLFNESELYSVYGNYEYLNEITQDSLKRNKKLKPVFVVTTYTSTMLGSIIKNWFNVKYSHALISLDPYLRTMYTYDAGGLIIDDIHRYMYDLPGSTMAVMCILVTPKMYDSIKKDIDFYVQNKDKTHYNLMGLLKWLKGSSKENSFGELWMICSEFVDAILKNNMIDLSGSSSANVHPATFGQYKVRNNLFLVYEGFCANYDGRKIEKNIEKLKKTVEFSDLFVMTANSMKTKDDIILGKKNHIPELFKGGLKYNYTIISKGLSTGGMSIASRISNRKALPLAANESFLLENEKPIYDPDDKQTIHNEPLELPDEDSYKPDFNTLFNNTDPSRIFLTSDWHLFINTYKDGKYQLINTQKIIKWCRDNIRPDDIFMYLGDISFRYATEEHQKKTQEIFKKLPGIKVLIPGNHDKMLGLEYITGCGFDYVFDQFQYDKLIFTHKPIKMDVYPHDYINIHGHIHNDRFYKTSDGSRNVNVFPYWFDNKPVTLKYVLDHWQSLVKDNYWLPNAGYGESSIYENLVFSKDDLQYRVNDFETGKINLAMVVGFAGSGKSTLGRELAKSLPNTEHCELDDVLTNWHFNDNQLKNKSNMVYNFFKDNKKFRITTDDYGERVFHKDLNRKSYHQDIIMEFVKYAIKYASIHKDTRFVLEGIWALLYGHDPSIYKNWCVVIKGTSYLVSQYRAMMRHVNSTKSTIDAIDAVLFNVTHIPKWFFDSYIPMDKTIKKWENYFGARSVVTETKRSNLPDSAFGIPEDRKFPLDSEKHVRSAIKLFGHAEESKKKSLAKRIQSAARKYDISIPENTQCYKYLHESLENNMIDIPEDINKYILAETEDGFINIPMGSISWWYIAENKRSSNVDSDLYYSTLEDCVSAKVTDYGSKKFFDEEDGLYLQEFVFISNLSLLPEKQDTEEHELVCIGEINVFQNKAYEWVAQYPIKISDKLIMPIKEYTAMNSINPVIGISKPFLINTGEKLGLVTDLEPDRMLSVDDETGVLNIEPVNGPVGEIYEFIGDKAYLDRLNEAYKNNDKVDNLYTILTGKELYTLDQVDFDESFRRVDLDLIEQNVISSLATLRDNIIDVCSSNEGFIESISLVNLESFIHKELIPKFVSKYNVLNDIYIKEDMDGVYFYSTLSKKRSGSVENISMLTENMLKSIL